ncbi:efflux RND transporter periplasmic adaptor subunit [Reyranella sp. CPCC 100927]|uniref:efflux RND transporter periplasmic adaptor subunit n=1 Tax=Reyranella sp. CPCC 100927 TaxID=2599616 RepID=UPI0011B7969A|nr:efflux RND transporter periplasmic adaptor subunit [Reyranella sp. CPCC 100927]TWS99625.1 efflux RND transporter periplasmic adaptor subunit [Reyranella sp. CPCC 100927]
MRRWPWTIVAAGLALMAIALIAAVGSDPDRLSSVFGHTATAAPQAAAQSMPVPVTAVVKRTIPIYLDYAARTDSIRSITLQAKVSGYILSQDIADGADVKEGDLLYRIDPRDYRAALDQVKAQLQRDMATLEYTRGSLERNSELIKTGALSKDTYAQSLSAAKQAEAAIVADRAAIQAAEINLAYTDIRAPFPGRLGRNQAPIGTLVNVGGAALNTLVQISPIYVTFTPSEGDLTLIRRAADAGPITVEVTVPGDPGPARTGTVTFIDNTVDRATGTITARATIANADRSLLPGQYVNIRVLVGEKPDTLLIPQALLGSSQLGKFVYVIDQGKVAMRMVELGPTQGPLVSVIKGIKDSDQIISGNLQKIGPGMPVTAQPPKAGS